MAHFRFGNRRGSNILEFALAGTFIFVPLLIGTATVGMSILRSVQVTNVNRDAGHMFAMGFDFSQAQNRNLLLRIANGLQITDSGGAGVIILSEILSNSGTLVCTRRLVIGNAAARASSFASPTRIDSSGNVNASDPGRNASRFLAVMPTMASGDTAYVAETYVQTPEYDWAGFLTGTGIYRRAIF